MTVFTALLKLFASLVFMLGMVIVSTIVSLVTVALAFAPWKDSTFGVDVSDWSHIGFAIVSIVAAQAMLKILVRVQASSATPAE